MPSIVATSDLHQHFNFMLPIADIAIIAGDWSYRGAHMERYAWENWLMRQRKEHPHMAIVWINGNHEVECQRMPYSREIAERTGTTYLEDEGVRLCGLEIWGSPYQPEFNNWAYQYPRRSPRNRWEIIPEGLDILITHGPPMKILDFTKRYYEPEKGEHVGCFDLLKMVAIRKPRVHIFGHIHDAYGYHYTPDTEFYNVARCNEDYEDVNPPAMIELR